MLGPLARRIERYLGRPTVRLSRGLGLGDVRDSALELQEAVCESAAPGRVDVVAHSMGGLIATYLLKCLDQGRRIRSVVALGTPFGGVAAARLGGLLLGPFGRSLRQATPGSPLLRLLARQPVPRGCALISIASREDYVVPLPATLLPECPGHAHLAADGLDHWQLALSQRGFARVAEALALPLAEPAAASAPSARREPVSPMGRAPRRAWPASAAGAAVLSNSGGTAWNG